LPFPKKIWLFNLTDVVLNLRLEKLREYLKAILLVAPRPLELNIFLNVANYCARLSRSMSKVVSPASSEKESPLSPMNDHKFCSLNFKMTVDNFTFLKVLGKGSFGKVYLVRPNGAPKSELYAMKVLRKSEVVKKQQINHTQQERQIMAVVSHPYLLSLRCAFQTDTKLYMITDYCPGGELFFHLKKMHRFTEGMMRYYCAQLVLALRHLHSHSIVYRDLKPENILLDRYGNCKLTDFGLSKMNHKERDPMSTFCGTPEYLSPEMILHRDSGYGYGYEIDWWALGVVCYELICGWPPFFDRDFHKMCEKIMTRPLLFPAKDKIVVSPDAQGFITQFLQREPFKRLGFGKKGFNDIKNQAFFAYVDWNQMEMGLGSPPFIPSMGKTATDTCNFDNDFTKLEINDLHESSPPDKSYLDSIQDSDQIFKTFSFIDIVYTGNISLQNEVADDGEDSRNYDFNDTFNSPMK
jgi:serine/threonine protein kinase